MTQKAKLFAKLSNQDADGNWTMDEVKKLLEAHGWTEDRVNGSHHIFGCKECAPIVIAAHGNSIKKGYLRTIRQVLLE